MAQFSPSAGVPNRSLRFSPGLWRVAWQLWLLLRWRWGLCPAASPARIALAQAIEPAATQKAAINAQLEQDLTAANGPVSFLVILKDQVDAPAVIGAAGATGTPAASAAARRAALYADLTARAEATQAPLRAWLDDHGVKYRPFYLVNMIEVYGDQALADQLRLRPEVDRLARNPKLSQTNVAASSPAVRRLAMPQSDAAASLPYGLTYTKANLMWAWGYHGEGIVVASQDTGVQWDHPALRSAYRGWNSATMTVTNRYNWYDAFGRDPFSDPTCPADPQVPCDDEGHGTHTVGTMVGDATVDGGPILGMAPAAKWIACRNMRGGVGSPASYTACFQFFLAPFPQGGNPFTDGKPEFAPNIVNNSWACPPNEGCDTGSLRQVVENVRAGGIFVAASAGNYGPQCNTVADPIAIYDAAFSVGAHDALGQLAYFSSRGPVTIDGSSRAKPDLAAPGVSVLSTFPTNSYIYQSGTSMASPHLAGAVALLWSAVPSLIGDIDRTEQVLLKSARPVLSAECSDGLTPVSPNNLYGYGYLDVEAAGEVASHPRPLDVSLRDDIGNPISATAVTLLDKRTGYQYPADMVTFGRASWSGIYPGDYEVVAIATGGVQYRYAQTVAFERWLPMIFKGTGENEQSPPP